MTISSTLSNALSGLTATRRASEVVSNNLANALTEGYSRRDIQLASRSVGGAGAGVQVVGVSRDVDMVLVEDRRLAQASVGDQSARQAYYMRLEQSIGTPDDVGSLTALLDDLEASLIDASSRPDSDARLGAVVTNANALIEKVDAIAGQIQDERIQADQEIGRQVELLNTNLAEIEALNAEITRHFHSNRDITGLLDQRQQLVDQVAEIIPVKEADRQHGQIALYTPGGAILLEGSAAEITFSPSGIITPDMTLAGGALSGLEINGIAVDTSKTNGRIAGGSLAAQFAIRDELAPEANVRIDAFARDLVERFQDPSVDATLGAADAGLFTDGGAFFDPLNEEGLASRLELNAAVDPAQGGDLWRLRDGINAVAQGPVGNASGLQNLLGALEAQRAPASGGFTPASRDASQLASDLLSIVGSERNAVETRQAQANNRYALLHGLELENGVDSDYELQRLLQIENAYAANARVIQTVEEMLDMLLRL